MAEHTFVDDDALTATQMNTDLMHQAVIICTSSTRGATWVGKHIYQTDTDQHFMWTGSFWRLMNHKIRDSQWAASATGPSAFSPEADINGTDLTFTSPGSTVYEFHWHWAIESDETGTLWRPRIYRDSTNIQTTDITSGTAGQYVFFDFWVWDEPSAASHTYKMTLEKVFGIGIGFIPTDGNTAIVRELYGT